MECTSAKKTIQNAFQEVSEFSYKQRTEEELTNELLDKVLELQTRIDSDTHFLESLCEKFEKITWFEENDIDDETLRVLNDILSISKELTGSLIRDYVFLNNNYRSYAGKAIKRFKNSIDDFKDSFADLEDIFFKLPHDLNFQSSNSRIQEL